MHTKNTAVIQFTAPFDTPLTHSPLFSMHGIFSTLLYGTTVVCYWKSFQHELRVSESKFQGKWIQQTHRLLSTFTGVPPWRDQKSVVILPYTHMTVNHISKILSMHKIKCLACHLQNLQFRSSCEKPVHQSNEYQYHISITQQTSCQW